MNFPNYNIAIIGAGPAGCSCDYMLVGKGLKKVLIDKSNFSRDKICGDALLSLDVVNQLKLINIELSDNFHDIENKIVSHGVRIVSPEGYTLDLPILKENQKTSGYVSERFVFDNFFLEEVIKKSDINVSENTEVPGVSFTTNGPKTNTNKGILLSKLVVGADGAQSIISKTILNYNFLKKFYRDINGIFHYPITEPM